MAASVAECYRDMIYGFENGQEGLLLCGSHLDSQNSAPFTRLLRNGNVFDGLKLDEKVDKIFDEHSGVLTLRPKLSQTDASEDTFTDSFAHKMPISTSYGSKAFKGPSLSYQSAVAKFSLIEPHCVQLGQQQNDKPFTTITLTIPVSSAAVGHATAVGDFDADGELDLAIAAPYQDTWVQDQWMTMAGSVFVLNGTRALLNQRENVIISDIRKDSQVILLGSKPRGRFGWSMAGVDINGDGIDDLAVAAPFANDNQGSVYIYFGNAEQLQNKPDVQIHLQLGRQPIEGLGVYLTSMDIDRDGFKDLIVGCPYASVNGQQQVRRYLQFYS